VSVNKEGARSAEAYLQNSKELKQKIKKLEEQIKKGREQGRGVMVVERILDKRRGELEDEYVIAQKIIEKELVEKKGQSEEGELVSDLNELCNELKNSNLKEYVTKEHLEQLVWSLIPAVVSYDLKTSTATQKLRKMTQCDINEINRVLNKYDINNCNRISHFLSQVYHEIQEGSYYIEGGNYTSNPIEEHSGRDDRPDMHHYNKGDGAKYRGAGFIQLTWKIAYEEYYKYQKSQYNDDSKIVSDGALYVAQNYAIDTGGWFWKYYKGYANLNKMCDDGKSSKEITKVINGGGNGLTEREGFYNKLKNEILKCNN
jgi:predicted chitinase